MGNVEEINKKYQTYYFFNSMINIKDFHPNLLKIEKSHTKTCIFITLGISQ